MITITLNLDHKYYPMEKYLNHTFFYFTEMINKLLITLTY